jgi:hypothetical protein
MPRKLLDHPPQNNIASTGALKILIPSIPVKVTCANKANEVNAAEAIAKLFLLLL